MYLVPCLNDCGPYGQCLLLRRHSYLYAGCSCKAGERQAWVLPDTFFVKFIDLFWERERERERESEPEWGRGETEREREKIPSRLYTVSTQPDTGLELTNCEMVTLANIRSRSLNQLSHPGAPTFFLSLFI